MSCAASRALATSGNGNSCRLMFLITQYNIAVGIGELNGQPLGLIPCNTPWMAVAGISATASSSNAFKLPISRIARRYPFNGEMAYSPHSIPRSLRWSFITASRRHFAPCPKNDKAGMLLKTLLFVSIKPGKIRLVIGKNTGHQFDIRAVIVGQLINPTPGQIHSVPSSTAFLPGAIWWLATCSKPPSSS